MCPRAGEGDAMDWNDTPEQARFRARARRFFEEKLPARYRDAPHADYHAVRAVNGDPIVLNAASWTGDRLSEDPEIRRAAADWSAALSAEGYVAPAWPQELGGAGLSTREQFIFHEERERAGAPRAGGTGAMFLGSVLMVHGNEEQRARYMPAIARGEIEWAQGYSEPGAGSDLASLSLRAERDGDEYVLNGQKIWSTPQTSDAIYCLVRTDPDAPKHRGISFLMVDSLTAPGIVMHPLLNACWDHGRFGETFFDNVRVPAANLIGEENRGWYVAMTLMDFDRASISGTGEDRRTIGALIAYARTPEGRARTRFGLSTVRAEVADRMVETEVGHNLSYRLAWLQSSGLIPNYEASMGKVFSTELHQRVARTGAKALGLYANLWPGEQRAPLRGEFADRYVRMIPDTIAGGTSEIQRNVIATRGLGLPRS